MKILKPARTAVTVAAAAALALARGSDARGAGDVTFSTDYVYPTEFELVPGVIDASGRAITETVVVPRNFQTREVGIRMSVEATVSDLSAPSAALASLEGTRNGNTPLMLAATAGDLSAVRRLLGRGASVNAKNYRGSTALMGASAGGFEDVVRLLLAGSANVNSKAGDGSTALMFAARNGHTDVVKLLLQKGAEPNAFDNSGLTALMYAVDGGHAETVQALLAGGANGNVRDRHGTTPLKLAAFRADEDVAALLVGAAPRTP
jgi:uncharacterized protein